MGFGVAVANLGGEVGQVIGILVGFTVGDSVGLSALFLVGVADSGGSGNGVYALLCEGVCGREPVGDGN